MRRFLLHRALQTLTVLFLLSLIVFGMIRMLPGDYLTEMELTSAAPRERIEEMRRNLGLDRPFYLQYLFWLGSLAQGDLGYSFAQQRPAAQLLGERFANTLLLALAAFAIVLPLTFALGITGALYAGRWPDRLGLGACLLGISFPRLLLALLVLYLAFQAGWLPGSESGLRRLILPALVTAAPLSAFLARQLRFELLGSLEKLHVQAAAARGLPARRIVWIALRDALNPLISLLGLTWAGLLSGAVIVESVFSWPGLGLLMVESLRTRDLFVVVNGVLLSAGAIALSNLLADVLLAINDPRIRYER